MVETCARRDLSKIIGGLSTCRMGMVWESYMKAYPISERNSLLFPSGSKIGTHSLTVLLGPGICPEPLGDGTPLGFLSPDTC